MKNFICFLFSKLGTLFLVLFCSSLYAQDISVKSITVNDNSAICSYDASNFEIVVVFNTDAAFDFRGKSFSVEIIEPTLTTSLSLTISSTNESFNLADSGTVSISLFNSSHVSDVLSGPTFTENGNSTINIEFNHDSGLGANSINNVLSKQYSVINIPTPTLFSTNSDPSNFSFCSTDQVVLSTQDLGGDFKYFWAFSQTSSVVTEGTNTITKSAGEIIDGEQVILFVTSGNCTSTLVTKTITINEPISNLTLTAAGNKTILCEDESVVLTVGGTSGTDSITWTVGENTYLTYTTTYTLNSSDFSSNVTVTVTVTPNGTACGISKSIDIKEIIIEAGEIITSESVLCSTETPAAITNVAAASSTTTGTILSYRWEKTTQVDGIFNALNTVIINSDTEELTFSGPLAQTTWFRRVAVGEINGIECIKTSDAVKIEVENIGGGTFGLNNVLYSCANVSNSLIIEPTDSNNAPVTYQWQSSTSGISSSSFSDINNETSSSYQITLTTSQTTYFRRISYSAQLSDTTCGVGYSDVFSYFINELDPGTLTDFSGGFYCYGGIPPRLGEDSQVSGDVLYRWQYVTGVNVESPSEGDWITIIGANLQTYSPPPLIQNINYRRSVLKNDDTDSDCWTSTEPMLFKVLDPLDVGFIDELYPVDGAFCYGEPHPALQLTGLPEQLLNNITRGTNGLSGDNGNPNMVWEVSTNKTTWQDVPSEPNNETNIHILKRNNGQAAELLLTQTLYYRAKFTYRDTGAGGSSDASYDDDYDLDTLTAVTTQTSTSESIALFENGTIHEGETYQILLGSTSVSVTTSTNSTTDQIGVAIAASINQINASTNITAVYYADQNIIVLSNLDSKVISVASFRGTADNPIGLDLYYLSQTNASQECEVYTDIYTLEVDPLPTMVLANGVPENQTICSGDPLTTPITVEYSGSFSEFNVNNIPAGLSISNTTSNSVTISGTPTAEGVIQFTLIPECDGDTLNLNYAVNLADLPPSIGEIFKDFDNPDYRIFYNATTAGYNNSVCVNTDESAVNTTKFYACFDEKAFSYANLEWLFIDKSGTNLSTPILSTTVLTAPPGSGTREDGAEIGVNVTWNRSFVTSITGAGQWVTVKVRSVSSCSSTTVSSWRETDVWVVGFSDTGQNSQTIPDLPILSVPEPNISNLGCTVQGKERIDIPTCEKIVSYTNQPYTQFFTQAVNGTNDFSNLEWDIVSNPFSGSSPTVGTINDIGSLTYTPGFYGTFRVRVRPVSCSSTSTLQTSNDDWVETALYTIGELEEIIPTISISGIPTCPIPESGITTSTFVSDIDVDWYIKDLSLIQAASVTQTGITRFNYIGIDGDAIDPLRQLTFTWKNGSEGQVKLKAVPRGCAGSTGDDEFSRNFTIEAPQGPTLAFVSGGEQSQQICEDETTLTPRLYDIKGKSIQSINIIDVNNPGSIYETFINTTTTPRTQTTTLTYNEGFSPNNRTFIYTITINGYDFKYNGSINQSHDDIMRQFRTLINSHPDYSVQSLTNSNTLVITGLVGVPFSVIDNTPSNSLLNLTIESEPVYSQFEISSLQQSLPFGNYEFEFQLIVDEGCVSESDVTFNLEVGKNVDISLSELGGTNSPEVCYNENFEDIVYNINAGSNSRTIIKFTGSLPSNVTLDKNDSYGTGVVTLTSNGNTNYWNTRTFNYDIVSEGNEGCDDGFNQGGVITIYPKSFIRPEGHFVGGENNDINIQQTVCSGSAIQSITYEYWGGASSSNVGMLSPNILGLNTSHSNRLQKASINFNFSTGETVDDTETYSILINDVVFTVPVPKSNTSTQVLNLLNSKLASDTTVVTSVVSGTELVITAVVSGTTFSLEGQSSNNATFIFGEPKMLQAPRVVTITGTPTIGVDDKFDTATITPTTYQFNLYAIDCDNETVTYNTYNLTINPKPLIQIGGGDGDSFCDGGDSNHTISINYKAANSLEVSVKSDSSSTIFLDPVILDVTDTAYDFILTRDAKVTATTTFTFTVTATAAYSCSATPTTAVVTGTFYIIPHYFDLISPTNLMSQTLCVGSEINPIQFDYSAGFSQDPDIQWGSNGNPGQFTLTTSGTSLTLSGTLNNTATITETTIYDFTISLEGSLASDSNCITYTKSGAITVLVGPKLDLNTSSATINQALCIGESPTKITYDIGGAATEVYDPEWKANGVSITQPTWIAYDRGVVGEFSLLGSTISDVVDVITVYEFELKTKNINIGGFNCSQDSAKGYITLYPNPQFDTTDFIATGEVCEGDYFEKIINFIGANAASVSPVISPLGLSSSVSYTVKQSFTLVVSGTASAGQTNTIQIINGNRNGTFIEESFTYTAVESSETSTTLATGFKNLIKNRIPSQFDVTSSGANITLTAAANADLFGIRFLTSDPVSMRVVSSTAVEGFISLTSTLTTDLVTVTTSFPIVFETENSSCGTDTLNYSLTVKPFEEINNIGGSLNQTICFGEAITQINISGATQYEIVWTPSVPSGISPTNGRISSPSFSISGTHLNNETSTTSYTYQISLLDENDNCFSDNTVSGTLTFYPKGQVILASGSGAVTQTICTGSALDPIIYDLSNGFEDGNYEINWPTNPKPDEIIVSYSQASNTLSISGSLPSGVTTETVYPYKVTFTSNSSCIVSSVTGSITLIPQDTVTLTSTFSTLDQTLCKNEPIVPIIFTLSDASSAINVTGLPTGLNYAISDTTLTISGTITSEFLVPKTYTFKVSSDNNSCELSSITGYISSLPSSEINILNAASPLIKTLDLDICNGDSINDIEIEYKNMSSLIVTNTLLPLGTDSLTLTNSISKRQETSLIITGTSSIVGEVYKINIAPIGGVATVFTYTTTETSRTSEQIAQGLFNLISNNATTVSATLDGSEITLYGTVSSTIFLVKPFVTGQALMTVNTTQSVEGKYVVSGTVSLSSDVTSFTLNLGPPSSSLCPTEYLAEINFIKKEAAFINTTGSTLQNLHPACDNENLTLNFEYGGEGALINSPSNIEWSPSNPGLVLTPIAGTNSFTLTGVITAGNVTDTVYNYTITTVGANCQNISFEGSIDINSKNYITHVASSVSFEGDSSQSQGFESQIICDGNPLDNPIRYEFKGGTTSHTISWSPSMPGGLTYVRGAAADDGYSFTLSGTIITNVTTVTTYRYSINTVGNDCDEHSRVGSITVRPKPLMSLVSSGLNYQIGTSAVCNLSTSEAIVYQFNGSTISAAISWTGAAGVPPGVINDSYNINNNQYSFTLSPNTTATETIKYEYSITSVSQYGCTPQIVLNGAIEVLPSVTILEDYIRANDINHVTCEGGIDGSINIPLTPNSDFKLRINGGQNAIAQIDKITLSTSATLSKDDIVRVIIDGITFSAIVPSNPTTSTIFQALADVIDVASTNVQTTVNEDNLLLTATTPGVSFTSSGVIVSSSVTGTTYVSSVVSNVTLDFEFTWTNSNGVEVGSNASLLNQPADFYTLTVSINGCATSSATFEIEEPTMTEGEIDISCDGDLSIPLSINLTQTQLDSNDQFTATLYELQGTIYTEVANQVFTPNTASTTYLLNYPNYPLEEGLMYRVYITDLFCSSNALEISNIGPVSEKIIINENLITTTAIQCWGENDGTITVNANAISGGSGSYSYQWTSDTGIQYNFKDLLTVPSGLYTLTVTDNEEDCQESVTDIEVENIDPVVNPVNSSSDLINQCIDGTNGLIQLEVGVGFDIKWEFVPSVTSQTFELTGAQSDFQFYAADVIPNGYSTTGVYTYYLYEGGLGSSCALDGGSITISGPSPVSLSSSLTFQNIVCAGAEDGTIQFTATGGVAPYLFSLTGGVPAESFSDGNTNYTTGLGPGTYDIVIGDSSPSDCTPNTFTVQVIITEPAGGPLELSEGELVPISCGGDLGSFEVLVSGGGAKKLNGVDVDTSYQVFVDGPGDSYALNTSHERGEPSFVVDNLVTAGDYVVTVTDGTGFCDETITITVETNVEGLSANAVIEGGSDCSSDNFNNGNTGYSIKLTTFEKGDGEVSGYPIWQKQSSRSLDSFTITLNGGVTGIDLNSIGINLTSTISTSIFATSTTSSTISSVQDVAALLAYNINKVSYLNATLKGSTILVKGEIINSVSSINASDTTLLVSVSSISKISESIWVDLSELAGSQVIDNLQAGFYRGIIRDGSGCGGVLVENTTQGGTIFQIDDPQSLQFADIKFDEITCVNPTSTLRFKLSNGSFTLAPNSAAYELTLNSTILKSSIDNSVSFTTGTGSATSATSTATSSTSSSSSVVGNYYTPNLTQNTITISDIEPGDYDLTVKNIQTGCVVSLNFSVEDAPALAYSGETEYVIDPCYDNYQDQFFDQLLIEGGTPFTNLEGETYYSLVWKYFSSDTTQSVRTINTLSSAINFKPSSGIYRLYIYDSNGCFPQDENGLVSPIEFVFTKELADLVVIGTAGANGDELSIPVSCEIDAEDGEIHISVESSDPNITQIPPYEISWAIQAPNNQSFEQKLLIEGSVAGDSLEVYTIRLNEIPFTYITQLNNEPKTSVVNELTQVIDQSVQFNAIVNPNNLSEIIITTTTQALLELEIVSRSTKLQMIKSTSNIAIWLPLDGTNGNADYQGYLDLNELAEGLYRYTIEAVNTTTCDNNLEPDKIQGVITVENENILEIREGPIVDEYLCNGQPGTLFLDVFDGDTGPLTFFYNNTPVTYEQVGTDQYIINIDSPVEVANLEIYNAVNCGLSREVRIGNGTPLFDFSSTNFEQSGSFLAREDVSFTDLSENEYESFEFIFGDGTQSDRYDRNYSEPILHEYAISGSFYVKLRIFNDLGCVDELTKTIRIGKGYNILVPNVFTPNGDIWNNRFRPMFNGLNEITLRIYDSKGGLLYEESGEVGKDPSIVGLSLLGWDGLNNSVSSPYYIYTINGKTIDDEDIFRDGTFIILR